MFVRHVVGKVQLYPYLHVVTWSLPRRYLGLLRIFNFPLEEYPHKFITHSSETLNSYEGQITKKSISQPQKEISAEDFAIPKNLNNEGIDIDQTFPLNSSAIRKKTKRPRRKPIVSIRVKLDDDLKDLKSKNEKNFDKILSECNKRSCMLVIAKPKSSNQDEFSLNFVNSSRFGKPFKKLLRKNRRKRDLLTKSKPMQSLSSDFCEENVHPPPKKNIFNSPNQIFSFKYAENENYLRENTRYFSKTTINQKLEQDLKSNQSCENLKAEIPEKNVKKENTQLVSQKKPDPKEKPVRNWPIITQLFNEKHIEVYKKYLESLNTQDEEDKAKINNHEDDLNVTPDLTEAREFHERLQSSSVEKVFGKRIKRVENAESQTEIENIKISDLKIEIKQTKESSTINKSIVESSNFYIVREKEDFRNSPQESYTSTAYLVIGASDGDCESKNNEEPNSSSQEKNVMNMNSQSQANTRLLNTSMKTYESIIKNVDEKPHVCETYDEENPGKLMKKNSSERKKKGFRRLLFFNIVLALFIFVVLGVIIFISIADNSTVNRVVEKYIKR